MIYLCILICFVLSGCGNNITIGSETSKKNVEVSSDFYFRICNGASERYNSKTGLFIRDYLVETRMFSIILTDNEKESIDSLFKAVNFLSFPPKFEIIWSDTAVITMIMPSFETSIEMCKNGTCKEVTLDLTNLKNPINDKDKALKYKELYSEIWKIIYRKEEYKNIPDSDVFYL